MQINLHIRGRQLASMDNTLCLESNPVLLYPSQRCNPLSSLSIWSSTEQWINSAKQDLKGAWLSGRALACNLSHSYQGVFYRVRAACITQCSCIYGLWVWCVNWIWVDEGMGCKNKWAVHSLLWNYLRFWSSYGGHTQIFKHASLMMFPLSSER